MRKFLDTLVVIFVIGSAFLLFTLIPDGRVEAQPGARLQPWSAQNTLAIGDASKSIKGAGATTTQYVVTALSCTVVVSAAQTVDVDDTTGTFKLLRLPASAPLGVHYSITLSTGVALPAGAGLRIVPAAAGPSIHCLAEGYTRSAY